MRVSQMLFAGAAALCTGLFAAAAPAAGLQLQMNKKLGKTKTGVESPEDNIDPCGDGGAVVDPCRDWSAFHSAASNAPGRQTVEQIMKRATAPAPLNSAPVSELNLDDMIDPVRDWSGFHSGSDQSTQSD